MWSTMLSKLRILEYQMNLIMDVIEDWYGDDIGERLDRQAIVKEMKDRIAAERRKELIKPVE